MLDQLRRALVLVVWLSASLVAVAATASADPAASAETTSDPAGGEIDLDSWHIERLEQRFPIASGDTVVEVDNKFGDVRVRRAPGTAVELLAVTQRHRDDLRGPQITPHTSAGRLRLVLGFAAGTAPAVVAAGDAPANMPEAWSKRRIDLAVGLPPDHSLVVHTDSGLLEIKGHAGAVEANTKSGAIYLRTGPPSGSAPITLAPITLRSDSGLVRVFLEPIGFARPVRVETVHGGIELSLRPDASTTAVLETAGRLTTDVSLEVERIGAERKRGRAKLGAGGGEIVLQSQRGDLALLLLPPHPAP